MGNSLIYSLLKWLRFKICITRTKIVARGIIVAIIRESIATAHASPCRKAVLNDGFLIKLTRVLKPITNRDINTRSLSLKKESPNIRGEKTRNVAATNPHLQSAYLFLAKA